MDFLSALQPRALLQSSLMASPDPDRLARWHVQKLHFNINHHYDGNYFLRASEGSQPLP